MENNVWNNGKSIAFLLAGICAGVLAMWGADRFCSNVIGEEKSDVTELQEIPWYEKVESFYNAYLVRSTEDGVRMESIYRINEETGQPVELRRWMLTGTDDGKGQDILRS